MLVILRSFDHSVFSWKKLKWKCIYIVLFSSLYLQQCAILIPKLVNKKRPKKLMQKLVVRFREEERKQRNYCFSENRYSTQYRVCWPYSFIDGRLKNVTSLHCFANGDGDDGGERQRRYVCRCGESDDDSGGDK
uniref:Secreted protein n=1 Tax=Syphacia muris TaxID=451379 RepID=A0A0N5AXX5_9BILA